MNIKDKARLFAMDAHSDQVRKSEPNKPMVIHPINVAKLLESYGFDDNVVAAGYLHDVVEDTKYELVDIRENFNEDVESLVKDASESDKSLSWEDRKKETIEKLKKIDLRHKAVVIADKINNLGDLDRLLNTVDGFDFSCFKRGYDEQKWYYISLLSSIDVNEHPMFIEYKDLVDKVFNDKLNIGTKYLSSDEYFKLSRLNYKKYEIKNLMNCIEGLNPYVIEFTGTPRTGKTSIINRLEEFFKKGGYKVKVIDEFTTSLFYKTNIKPLLSDSEKKVILTEIPKYILEQLEKEYVNGYDIILIDRSLFDRCIWMERLFKQGGISQGELDDYYDLYIPLIKKYINIVISTYTDSITCMKRDYKSNLSLENRSFLNESSVNEYNAGLLNTSNKLLKADININNFNSTNTSLEDMSIDVCSCILFDMLDSMMIKIQELKK